MDPDLCDFLNTLPVNLKIYSYLLYKNTTLNARAEEQERRLYYDLLADLTAHFDKTVKTKISVIDAMNRESKTMDDANKSLLAKNSVVVQDDAEVSTVDIFAKDKELLEKVGSWASTLKSKDLENSDEADDSDVESNKSNFSETT